MVKKARHLEKLTQTRYIPRIQKWPSELQTRVYTQKINTWDRDLLGDKTEEEN